MNDEVATEARAEASSMADAVAHPEERAECIRPPGRDRLFVLMDERETNVWPREAADAPVERRAERDIGCAYLLRGGRLVDL